MLKIDTAYVGNQAMFVSSQYFSTPAKGTAGSEPEGSPRILEFKNSLVAQRLMHLIHQLLLSSAFLIVLVVYLYMLVIQ